MEVKDQDNFARVVQKLLGCTFITRKNEENKRDYYFIERNEELFRQYLKHAGWTLVGDRAYGVYQVMSDFSANRLHFRMEESIILLIIRLCYEEKRNEINLTDNICVKVRDIQDKYVALKIRAKPIDKKSLKEAISIFKRFNILRVLDGDVLDPDCRLEVYPTILFTVRVDDIRSVYDKLDSYRSTSTRVEETYEDVDRQIAAAASE